MSVLFALCLFVSLALSAAVVLSPQRIRGRIKGGLVVDMAAPDYETRVAILRRKAEERGAKFEGGVLEAVAGQEYSNVRELMGALNRLVAFQAVNEAPIE